MAGWHIGIIGGSGLADGVGLEDAQVIRVSSPFGEPSGPVTTGRLGEVRVTFLARHGAGHRLPPSAVDYRANIDVLKRCGVTDVLALSAIGSLRVEQLYFVVFVVACLSSIFSSAYPAYVPSLVGPERIIEANAKLATSGSIAEIGGPGLAGFLVQLFRAPFAVLVDAVSFVFSAVSLLLIRSPEPARPARTSGSAVRTEIVEGLRAVRDHRVLWPMAVRSIVAHVAGSFYGVLYTIYLINDLKLDPLMLGIVISAGGVGSLVGSLFASSVIKRLGLGPALIWTAIGASMLGILTPLAQGPLPLVVAMVLIPQLFGDGLQTIEGVAETSLIQGLVPDRILGRVNATLETVSHGIAYPLGALSAAALAGVIGARGGIAIGWAGMAVSIAILVLSPLPRVRRTADYQADPQADFQADSEAD